MDPRAKRLTLLACILGSTIVMVDGSVVGVALPHISADLGGGLAGQQWTNNAYLVTLGALLMVAGSLGDVYGARRLFLVGVVGFGLTSVLCAFAPTIETLVAGRALQGASGALLTPAALAVIVATFDEGERARAIGTWTAWGGIGAAVGPLVGGWLVDAAGWEWVFLVNVPHVLVTAALVARVVPASTDHRERRLDLTGAALCVLGLAGMTFGLIQQPLDGWGSPLVIGPLVGGAVLFGTFLAHEARTVDPMLPLGLFRRRNFSAGNVETLLVYAGLALLFFYLTIYLQQIAGFTALEAGLASVPVTIVMLVLAGRFGALADRIGPRGPMAVGPVICGIGLLGLLRVDADASFVADVLPAMVVFGLGLAIVVAPLTAAVLADADADNAGTASGVNNAVARVAGLVGIAAVGVVVASSFAGGVETRLRDAGIPDPVVARVTATAERDVLRRPDVTGLDRAADVERAVVGASTEAYRIAIGVAAGLMFLGGLIGGLGIRNPRRELHAAGCAGGQVTAPPEEAVRPAVHPA
ncbi:MAG: DHA2 family efflux MFS transporter permease subunit [Solirubrobacteraceae bacterium]